MNTLIIAGNLGRDADHRVVGPENTPVCNFAVAVNERRKNEDVTTWFDCALWGKRADALAQYLTRGTKVTVSGSVSLEQFDRRDGSPGAKMKVFVQQITLQGGGQQQSQPASRPAQQPAQGQQGGGPPPQDFDDDIPFAPVDWRFS